MGAARSFETLGHLYYPIRCGNAEDHQLYSIINEAGVQQVLKHVVERGISVVNPNMFIVAMSDDPIKTESLLIITKKD
jgi:hypothetical protein